MRLGGPIVIEEFLEVDWLASPSLSRPRQISTAHLDLDAQLGRRGDISTYAQAFASIRSEETSNLQVRGWYPGSVIFPL